MTTRSHGLLDQVAELIRLAKELPRSSALATSDSTYIASQLTRHGCVLTCAALEQAVIEAGSRYGKRIGNDRIAKFIESTLSSGRNPKPDYIAEVLGRFDPSFAVQINAFMDDNAMTSAVKSIVSNRNRIAHGENVSFGVVALEQWAKEVRKLCLEIHRVFQ
ncbi:MAG: hypothetical protein FP825_17940 [Hyphomonas sp.]|uniref:HEPN domain-containing protein n=1 Tax=Hyphomonas sp. TaxID=87 RepID=UPI0017F03BB8|nr:HEPN domain-containing protein [Hyphomonas sp.]MBA3070343.1 hypothetical protein [Hyphomonas sp.]MBU3920426.1 hypothetical protein [Alphaproteobacteria bacterium]MBU4062830.1 hypothetical protein [Alphaproteobacteria bacterium]MBU4163749.1 hypothetical protein [Alphaproteobacteria bacterium]